MNPGSQEAIDHGCTCPVSDNGYGKGVGGDGERNGWWVNADCPLHGQEIKYPENGVFEKEEA